ncbi:MAG TPA: DUF5681 domain-containing protein [Blastocatellia bacterium]
MKNNQRVKGTPLGPQASSLPITETQTDQTVGELPLRGTVSLGSAAPTPSSRPQNNRSIVKTIENNGRNSDGTFQSGHNFGFQPGQSGNPGGRTKSGGYPLSDRIRANMTTPLPGDPRGRTLGELIADNVSESAARGDFKSLLQVFDRVEGPPRRRAEPSRSEDAALWIRIASRLLAECDDSPEAKRAILAAIDKIDFEDD